MSKIMIDRYLEYIESEKDFSKNTLDAYIRDIRQFIEYIEEVHSISIKEVNKNLIIKYLMELEERGRANSTISRNLASIRSLFQYLLNKNIVEEDPTFNLKSYPTRRKSPDILTIDEINILLAKPNTDTEKGSRDRAMIHLISTTGLRVSEMINLNLGDLDLSMHSLNVEGEDNRGDRLISLDMLTLESLENYLSTYRQNCLDRSPLFTNVYGDRLSRQGFWKILKDYSEKIGINKKVTPHTLRHSFAANMIRQGVDIKEVQKILGHSDLSTTEIYL